MNDLILGYLSDALRELKKEMDAGVRSREQSLAVTKIEEAMLWRRKELEDNRHSGG